LYDPAKRERRGVYYTPRPVVNYIVKSVEWIIRNNFGKQLGFADDDVTILDPATGTGTFLWLVYLRTLGELKEKGLGGLIESKTKNQILKNFFGLEILITPYIIAHLKLAMILKRWHYELGEGERVQVYLTNSLDQGEDHGLIPFMKEINEERRVAHDLIMKKPILAIIGNPPYSGMSANKGKWIDSLLKNGYKKTDGSNDEGYYKLNGQPLGEKNPKMLQDDYVKFIRFAQWKIDKAGEGVVGFITNNGYLDNITFRGMRQSLLNSFERIYILNLHGNVKKKDKSPDGGKDENVFDIQQGTAIVLFIKNTTIKDRRIFYKDLYGLQEEKYYWLDRNTVFSTEWQEITPEEPYYLFTLSKCNSDSKYLTYKKITEIFPSNNIGIQTGRDDFTIHYTRDSALIIFNKFLSDNPEILREKYHLGKDTEEWKVNNALMDLKNNGVNANTIKPIFYRPFDIRFTYYSGKSRGVHARPRYEIMQHMLKPNLGLHTCRQLSGENWQHILISEGITDDCYVSNKTKERGYLFPLYRYQADGTRHYNIDPILLENLSAIYAREISPEEIFYYTYGVLYSQKYRSKFTEFLKIDFPRIPFTQQYSTFLELSRLGKYLIELHLMKKQQPPSIKYEVPGSKNVESVKYTDGKLFINQTQYFENIPENVWNFCIGGYLVLDKWLKSRKKRELSVQEILHFIQIVEVLRQTIRIMDEIDKIDFLPKE
jgi:predicted helicase